VILCEARQTQFETATAQYFEIAAIPVIKQLSIPIVAGPVNGTDPRQVPTMAGRPFAVGGGLLIEVHKRSGARAFPTERIVRFSMPSLNSWPGNGRYRPGGLGRRDIA